MTQERTIRLLTTSNFDFPDLIQDPAMRGIDDPIVEKA